MASPAAYGVSTPGAKSTKGVPSAKSVSAAKPKAAAAAPASAVTPSTVKRYSGAFSGALNSISDQEQRAQDVAARRQADAKAYAAYVMGAQGSIAAAAHNQDMKAATLQSAVQGQGIKGGLALQQGLQAQRAAQGIQGSVPVQQQAGLVDDLQRNNSLLNNVAGAGMAQANTNAGKAAFLGNAALANLTAQQRAIAGDAFNQQSTLEGQKTDILTHKTDQTLAAQQAAQAAAASQANAQLAHEDRISALENSANIANASQANQNARTDAQLKSQAKQGHLNRVVKLKSARETYGATGLSPARAASAATNVSHVQSTLSNLLGDSSLAAYAKQPGIKPADLRTTLTTEYKNVPAPVVDYVMAHFLGKKAGVTKGKQPSAAARYYSYLNDLKAGKINP